MFANEVIFTLPSDTPSEQECAFFEESLKYLISTLPLGERAIFLAECHCDEGQVLKDGKTVVEGQKHLHVMYVPAVEDTKHDGYKFRLCSDALTRRSVLKQWHPKYQKWLDDAGIKATVYCSDDLGCPRRWQNYCKYRHICPSVRYDKKCNRKVGTTWSSSCY